MGIPKFPLFPLEIGHPPGAVDKRMRVECFYVFYIITRLISSDVDRMQ
jgi:hypothetical protein